MFTWRLPVPWLRRKAGTFSTSMRYDDTGGVAVVVTGRSATGVGLVAISVTGTGVVATSFEELSTSAGETSATS